MGNAIRKSKKMTQQLILQIEKTIRDRVKTSPENPYTWRELQARFGYTRQALSSKKEIAAAHRDAAQVAGTIRPPAVERNHEQKILELMRKLEKIEKERDRYRSYHERCLSQYTELQRLALEKGISLIDELVNESE